MAVLEALTDEECALWSILQDVSGLDLAEFAWTDEGEPDGCFRAWAFQWKWFRCTDPLQIDQCARSVGKTLSIQMRAFVFPFVHPGREMVITGPEGIHVEAVTDLIETRFVGVRLGQEMLKGASVKITHKPFHMNLANSARIMGRIPQVSGKGVKGIHPIWLELDEAQDYVERGWTELIETLKRGFQGAVWRAHGVTRGVRDKFYEFTDETNPDNDWTVHRIVAMHRPNWTDEERQEKIKMYGGKDDPDYRRNVLGLHGDATNPIFVLSRLMQCVDDDKSSDYNTQEYYSTLVKDSMLREGESPVDELYLPDQHISKYRYMAHGHQQRARYWIGMDVGVTRDPSEILVFVETRPTKQRVVERNSGSKMVAIPEDEQKTVLKLLSRISLRRISIRNQAKVVMHLIDFYQPVAVSIDKTGVGLGLFQAVQELSVAHAAKIRGYGFSEKVIVEIDETVEVDPWTGDLAKDAGMKRSVLEWSMDKLRDLVDDRRLLLPWDRNLIGQFQGATKGQGTRGQDQYGRTRIFNSGEDHALDGCRMAAMAYSQETIEDLLETDTTEPVMDVFVDEGVFDSFV